MTDMIMPAVSRWIDAQTGAAKEVGRTFVNELTDPDQGGAAHAMEWADGAFMSAARLRLFTDVHRSLAARDGRDSFWEAFQDIVNGKRDDFMRLSSRTPSCTSACSNLMHACHVAAYSRFLGEAEAFLEAHEVEEDALD